jgi:unsaturated pyranuronate lyase
MKSVHHEKLSERSGFFHLGRKAFKNKREGVNIKSITGRKSQLTIVRLESGIKIRHTHRNEQIGYILSGKVRLKIGAASQTLGPGDGYLIPSNVEHAFTVLSTSNLEYVEIFCPPKKENRT